MLKKVNDCRIIDIPFDPIFAVPKQNCPGQEEKESVGHVGQTAIREQLLGERRSLDGEGRDGATLTDRHKVLKGVRAANARDQVGVATVGNNRRNGTIVVTNDDGARTNTEETARLDNGEGGHGWVLSHDGLVELGGLSKDGDIRRRRRLAQKGMAECVGEVHLRGTVGGRKGSKVSNEEKEGRKEGRTEGRTEGRKEGRRH